MHCFLISGFREEKKRLAISFTFSAYLLLGKHKKDKKEKHFFFFLRGTGGIEHLMLAVSYGDQTLSIL